MRSVADHQAVVLELVQHRPSERLALADAAGLVLAEDLHARQALPAFDNSAMDGYAVRASDIAGASETEPVALPVAADIPAGRIDGPPWPREPPIGS